MVRYRLRGLPLRVSNHTLQRGKSPHNFLHSGVSGRIRLRVNREDRPSGSVEEGRTMKNVRHGKLYLLPTRESHFCTLPGQCQNPLGLRHHGCYKPGQINTVGKIRTAEHAHGPPVDPQLVFGGT